MGRMIDTDAIKWDKCEDADGNPVYVLDKEILINNRPPMMWMRLWSS